MKGKRFHRQQALLQVYAKASPKLKKAIIQHSDDDFIHALIDVVGNTLRGNIGNIPPKMMKQMYKHKRTMRYIAQCCKNKNTAAKRARPRLNQVGGFIIPGLIKLASVVVPAIASAFS